MNVVIIILTLLIKDLFNTQNDYKIKILSD